MINHELKIKARQADLAQYLLNKGITLKPDGRKRYKHIEHDSLVFTDNSFQWNSKKGEGKGIGWGNSIDYLMNHMGMDYKTAVLELTNQNLDIKKEPASPTKRIPVNERIGQSRAIQTIDKFTLPNSNKDMKRVFAYLTKTRKINSRIIQDLVKVKLLMQDEQGNAVFPFIEGNCTYGAELHGTLTYKRFKGTVEASQYGYGYNIKIGNPKRLIAFESAIELLSFWTLKPDLKDTLLLSLAGLKEEVLLCTLKRSKRPLHVFLATNNDEASEKFIQSVQAQINVQRLAPNSKYKDWNELLLNKVGVVS